VASAQERAAEARAEAKEARRGIGAISTKVAEIEAERRRDEQEEWRLELECAELRSRLEQLRAQVGEQAREVEQRQADRLSLPDPAAVLDRGTGVGAPERRSRVNSSDPDGRIAAMESRARVAADRVAATQRKLARAAERLRAELERRLAEEAGYAKATTEIELSAARRRLAEARLWVPGPVEPGAEREADDTLDPLEALEASLEERRRDRDGSEPVELDQLPKPPRSLFGRIRARLTP
jgi:hypothetical protein